MTNREYITKALSKRNLVIGCYSPQMELLSKRSINRVLEASEDNEYADVNVTWKGQKLIVEIATVDQEQDFRVITTSDYIGQYGRAVGQ